MALKKKKNLVYVAGLIVTTLTFLLCPKSVLSRCPPPEQIYLWLYNIGCPGGHNSGGGEKILTLPENYEKVILIQACFDDNGYILINGINVWNDNIPGCCSSGCSYPNIDVTAYFVPGDNVIYGYADDCCGSCASARAEFQIEYSCYPSVINHTPADRATDVPTDTDISITFSQSMDISSTEASFNIDPVISIISDAFTWTNDNKTLTFTPNTRLAQEQQYTISIDTAATDTEGNNLENTYSFSFTTRQELTVSFDYYARSHDDPDGYYSSNYLMVGGLIFFKTSISYTDPSMNGDIVSYKWEFGDGKIIEDTVTTYMDFQYVYTSPGIYKITFTATDSNGYTSKYSRELDLAQNALQNGDILLCRSENSFVPHSYWTHAGIYTDKNGKPQVIEACAKVKFTDFEEWMYPNKTCVIALRVNTDPNIRDRAVEIAASMEGKSYDYVSLLYLYVEFEDPTCPLKQIDCTRPQYCYSPFYSKMCNRLYCSELVWLAYMKASGDAIDLESDDVDIISSDDINFSYYTEPIGKHEELIPNTLYENPWRYIPNSMLGIIYSPVDFSIIDPDGLILTKQENEISEAIYIEDDIDGNGDTDDLFVIPEPTAGDYLIQLIPETNALPDDTYSLEILLGGETVVQTEDTPVSDIPEQPYLIQLESPVADAGGPYVGYKEAVITFDASNSYDPDGTIVLYKWDWDNDGIYDETVTTPTITHTWIEKYSGSINLMVEDNIGLTGTNTVTVDVIVFTVPGDLNSDGIVDRDDMNIILAARNTPASGPDDPRDLDGDGMITALDARKLILLCTCPRCVCP